MYILTYIYKTITLKTCYTYLFNRFIRYNIYYIVYKYLTHNHIVLSNHNIEIYNPVNSLIVSHSWMGVGPTTGEQKPYQWPHLQKRMILCHLKKLSCANRPPYYAAILVDLIVYQPYSRNHSCYKFMTVDNVMFQKQNIVVLFSSPGS